MIARVLAPDDGCAETGGIDMGADPVAARWRLLSQPEGAPACGAIPVSDCLSFCGGLHGLRRRIYSTGVCWWVRRSHWSPSLR